MPFRRSFNLSFKNWKYWNGKNSITFSHPTKKRFKIVIKKKIFLFFIMSSTSSLKHHQFIRHAIWDSFFPVMKYISLFYFSCSVRVFSSFFISLPSMLNHNWVVTHYFYRLFCQFFVAISSSRINNLLSERIYSKHS